MENEFKKTSAISLLLSSLTATITMALHPMGGDIAYIAKISNVLMFSHSVAIICMPFVGFGFWGLSNLLQTKNKLSILAFYIFCFGLFALMIAATMNGLVLPQFSSNYSSTNTDSGKAYIVLEYGMYVSVSMTYIFITAVAVSISIWSSIIIRLGHLPNWLGYFGLAIVTFGLIGVVFKFNYTNIFGFRTFVAGLVSWKVAIGFMMLQKSRN